MRVAFCLSRLESYTLALFGQHHVPDFQCFLKMIQLVRLYPPCRRFHQQLRIVVFIGEKSIKRQTYALAFQRDFLLADGEDFLLECGSHGL